MTEDRNQTLADALEELGFRGHVPKQWVPMVAEVRRARLLSILRPGGVAVSRSVLDFGFLYRSETFGETSVFLRKTRRSERQRKENVARRQKDISRRRTESRVFFSLHDVLN